jgi:tRNA (adenine-N(1)-)-methyltransferase non-catalytic subunit
LINLIPDDFTSGDNSTFVDTNTAQKLKPEDIQQLREKGVAGSEIIRSLIQNSETWDSKSQFAKEKWLARKQKRYMIRISNLS